MTVDAGWFGTRSSVVVIGARIGHCLKICQMLNGLTYKRKKKSMQVEWPRSHRHSQACGRMTRTVGEDNRLLRVVDIRMPHPVGNGATALQLLSPKQFVRKEVL